MEKAHGQRSGTKKSQQRCDERDGQGEEAAMPDSGHCHTTLGTSWALRLGSGGHESHVCQPRRVGMCANVGKPMSVSAGMPGGCQGTRGDRCHLTLEVGVQLNGLACPWVLADHLLEVNLGDLDQVPCGEAALIPRDLVDGACGDTDSVSPLNKGQALGSRCLFPHKPCSAAPLHTCSCHLECRSLFFPTCPQGA